MRGHGRFQLLPGVTRTGLAVGALLAAAACGKGADAGKSATADTAAAGAAGAGAIPVIAIIRAADWIANESLTGFVLLPVMWGTETTIAYRRLGGKAALAVAAAGPLGGIA